MKCEPGKQSSSTKSEQPFGNEAAAAAAPETAKFGFDNLAETIAFIAAPEATAAPFEILPCEIQEVAEPEGSETTLSTSVKRSSKSALQSWGVGPKERSSDCAALF